LGELVDPATVERQLVSEHTIDGVQQLAHDRHEGLHLGLAPRQQAIQNAFRDVSDALVAYQKTREAREQQELLAAAAQDSARLAHVRYNGGATAYLEVLTNETNYLAAELALSQARLNEMLSLVQIYSALGGGWQQ
jgi:outer membrane protein TolC